MYRGRSHIGLVVVDIDFTTTFFIGVVTQRSGVFDVLVVDGCFWVGKNFPDFFSEPSYRPAHTTPPYLY